MKEGKDWIRGGRPPRKEEEQSSDGRLYESSEDRSWTPAREAAIPVTAEFGVTGLYQDGEWRDSADLEAARAFLQSRFDLRIGIWDLAKNPSLRANLLNPAAVTPVPTEAAPIPTGSARRTASYWDETHQEEETHDAFREAVSSQFTALREHGWQNEPPQDETGVVQVVVGPTTPDLILPLTEPMLLGDRSSPLAHMSLSILKRSARVSVDISIGASWDLHKVMESYLDSRSERLSEIAAPGKLRLSGHTGVLWEVKGGWGDDDVDWPNRIAELVAKTGPWLEALRDLAPKLVDAHRASSALS